MAKRLLVPCTRLEGVGVVELILLFVSGSTASDVQTYPCMNMRCEWSTVYLCARH